MSVEMNALVSIKLKWLLPYTGGFNELKGFMQEYHKRFIIFCFLQNFLVKIIISAGFG